MKTINPLQASWAILTPLKGVATKSDRKKCGEIILNGNRAKRITLFSGTLKGLNNKIEDLKGSLSKQYEVIVITDKQFGKMINYNTKEVATTKQKENIFILN